MQAIGLFLCLLCVRGVPEAPAYPSKDMRGYLRSSVSPAGSGSPVLFLGTSSQWPGLGWDMGLERGIGC